MQTYTEMPLTVTDLEAAPDDGNRYEVIDGELYVSASPGRLHQTVAMNIGFHVMSYFKQHPVGFVIAGLGVIFDQFNGVIPDLIILTKEREAEVLKGERLTGAPEIAIEILSPGSSNEHRDRQVKHKLYSTRGVDEYWIVDPEDRSIEIYRKKKQGGLELAAHLNLGDELTTTLLPGFAMPVAAVFEE